MTGTELQPALNQRAFLRLPFASMLSGTSPTSGINAMSVIATFAPHYTRGQIVTPAAASASIKIGNHKKTLCLSNLGTSVCYVRVSQTDPAFPNADISASTADYPVMPGSQVTISKPTDSDTLSFISATGTTLHVISGEGF